MLQVWSVVLATLLCLTTTKYGIEVSAMKATSVKLKANPMPDFSLTKRSYLESSFRPNNQSVFGFYVDVNVGTPPQFFSLTFSSSSTTWLPASNLTPDEFCNKTASGNNLWACFYNHYFEPSKSSTFKKQPGELDNYYGTGLFAKGTWGSDIMKINQLTISNVSFGLASNWTNAAQIGLGVEHDRRIAPYPSVPEIMESQGHINSVLYSIYIDEIQRDGGEIYFGAVDDAKYSGELRTFDTLKVGQIPITGVYWIDPNGSNSSLVDPSLEPFAEVGELQLGTPSLWLPSDIYSAVVGKLKPTYATELKALTVQCDVADSQLGKLQINIDGMIVTIDARQMLVEYPKGQGTCVLTVYEQEKSSTSSPGFLLGSPFLRSAYSVWDFTNNQTSIGVSVPDARRSVVREVPREGISALAPPDADRSDPASTSASPLPTGGDSNDPEILEMQPNGPNVGAIAGGTIGGVAILGAIAFLVWFFMFRRRKTAPQAPLPPPDVPGAPNGSPEMGNTYFGAQFKPEVNQQTYGVPPSAPYNSPPTNYQDHWGTGLSDGSGTLGSLGSGGTLPPAHDLSSYVVAGNPRQSGQYGQASEMPAYRYNNIH